MPRRLLAIASHPIQYFVPVYRALHERGRVTIRVLYCRDFGNVARYDKQFGASIKWDVDLLQGYENRFLHNWSPITDPFRPLHAMNPGVVRDVLWWADAVWVNGFWYPTNWLAAGVAKLARIPVLFRGELRPEASDGTRRSTLRDVVHRKLLSYIDRVLYIGSENRLAYQSLGVPAEKMKFCPYSVDMGRFNLPESARCSRREAVRSRLGISPREKVVLFMGKLTRRKRATDLLALDGFQEANNIVLLWVGSGEMENEIRQKCRILTRCRGLLAGFVNQAGLADYLWAADVFVFPSVREPWGLVMNEAMAAGLPVVVSDDVGAAADLCVDGVTGFRFPAGNYSVMAERIFHVLRDDRLRRSMSDASHRLISAWTPEATAEGIEEAVREATA